MEENRVKGKIAFVSGASSGIGKATAEKLAQMGVNLILCARRENILNELKEKSKKVIWNNNKREEYYILFSKSGFSQDLIELVKKESNIVLKELL